MAQTQLKLYVNDGDPSNRLLAFPIVMKESAQGGKVLQPQLRISYLGDAIGGRNSVIFINCYGFIESMKAGEGPFLDVNSDGKGEVITAAGLTLGSVTYDSDPTEIARSCYQLLVTVKKSADNTERVVYTLASKPPALSSSRVVTSGGCILSAEEAVKCPSKLQSGIPYKFRIMFVSLTYIHQSTLYRVNNLIAKLRSPVFISVQLQVTLILDLPEKHPMGKYLINQDGVYKAHIWMHICNFKKTNRKGADRSVLQIKEKVRKMGLKVTLADLWGPTVVVEATGTMSKYAVGFFSETKVSCHPISKISPEVAKIIWACTTTIGQAVVIIQASSRSELLTAEDIECKGTTSIKKSAVKEFSLFSKPAK
ncbi:matrix protein [avian paramyxovirus 5]|uniref:Matrix protein n=1 Tax=avian paramyxovirus 5 TaxID=2560315 RepID=D3X606_9MONO|nr:matrix protein [Avian metaavulavirus 5]ADD39003.1 matrix protein [Avian metaavulavirus 5]